MTTTHRMFLYVLAETPSGWGKVPQYDHLGHMEPDGYANYPRGELIRLGDGSQVMRGEVRWLRPGDPDIRTQVPQRIRVICSCTEFDVLGPRDHVRARAAYHTMQTGHQEVTACSV